VVLGIIAALSLARPASAETSPYNIVLIVSDDQRADMVTPRFTPRIWKRLAAPGTRFKDAFVPTPLCCPSRASILSGNFAHTTGVWNNRPPHGGFGAFDDSHTIAVDFDEAGYRTAMIGKYLNGYLSGWNTYVPPGWDKWFATPTAKFYNYRVTTNRGLLRFGDEPKDYIARVLTRRAKAFVRNAKRAEVPFFLYLSHSAPHDPAVADPRDVGRFAGVVTDTPRTERKHLDSAYSIDRSVGSLLDVLPRHTIVVYLSDNGFLWGEHGLRGKQWPYDESIRIPLIMRSLDGRWIPKASATDLVSNVDLRPTLTRAAGVPMLTRADGLNLGAVAYTPRARLPLEKVEQVFAPTYCGVREKDWMYVRYADGSEELYDEVSDPGERFNLAAEAAFAPERDRLRGKAMSLCEPPPPGYSWG
jgi:N-acetylglucosamine-6-sulfatase